VEADAVDRLLVDRAVLENIPGRVILLSRDKRVLYLNRTSSRASTAEVVGLDADALLAEESRAHFDEAFEGVWRSGEPGAVDVRAPSGTWWETRIAPIKENGQVAFVLCTLFDVTAKKKLQEQLTQAQKMEAIGQLAAGIAHNFNNLLAIILPNTQLCRTDHPHDQRLADIEQAGRRATDLVRQLVLFAASERAGTRVPLDLVTLAHRIADMCRATFDRRIAIKVEAPAPVPPVLGGEAQVEQALLNVCINARDALEEGGIARPQIVIAVERGPAEVVRIRISDNGPGMSEATRLRVFEPFFTTKDVGRGTGLGLASSYAVVSEHGGQIRCESEPGAGAIFEIDLPAAEGTARTAAVTDGPKIVLIIDDEPLVRRVLRAILEQNGYAVVEATDGAEGVRAFEQQRASIGAVILDRSMPGISAEETYQRLGEVDARVPVLLLSGLPSESWQGGRPAAVLPKPVDARDLMRSMRRLLPPPR
jgi:PAS domain S-box-containing protein